MHDIIILGAGGFGREILSWVPECFPAGDYRLKGYLDQDPGRLDGFDVPVPVLAAPGDYQVQPEDHFLVAVGDPAAKERVVEPILAQGGQFLTMVHPSAVVASNASIGVGVVLYPFVGVSSLAVLRDFTHLNFYASVGHDVEIGAYSTLSPYATVNGMCSIGRSVFMGTHTSVAVGATVGDRTKISSNSCVMKSVGADQFVFGVPGKAIAQIRG